MKCNFYDIESLRNVFTLANFKPDENVVDIYYLLDNKQMIPPTFAEDVTKRVHSENKNFTGAVKLYDLSTIKANYHLARTFGLSNANLINNPASPSDYDASFRLVCDTDPDYDPDKHPYLMGYNSYNYDTTMLALYFSEVFQCLGTIGRSGHTMNFAPTTASLMREYNDELFSSQFKNCMPDRLKVARVYGRDGKTRFSNPDYNLDTFVIRKNMLLSGRHLDVARLNEKQQKVGLKRLLGMLGFQIKESDKLKPGQDTIDNYDQLLDLFAYNTSDVVNLKPLSEHKAYSSAFELKSGLLKSYPELIYQKQQNAYKPDIRPERVRRDRLTIDSSSAQFATKALCPYEHLSDIPVVSFNYPSKEKAKELGIKQVNVLEESKKFFYSKFSQPEVRAKFDTIYNYYKSIEGKNFNESKNYLNDFGDESTGTLPPAYTPHKLSALPTPNLCMFYYNKDGSPSTCFVTFSTGGIHGAEFNKKLYDADYADWKQQMSDLDYIKSVYPNPIDMKKAKKIELPDGREITSSKVLKAKATLKHSEYRDFTDKEPVIFKCDSKGHYKINPKYVFTSADETNHEDFTSYYPNMLRMLSAFFNKGLGYDRYGEVFDNKQKYGKLMKDDTLPEKDKDFYAILREGTKLILNSASGAGDANFDSNIRMNNRIISMRIIGQLFTWRIGQAQTIEGAKVTSTNTDGLYTVLDPKINDPILERESKDINVEIEPEPMYLISKDSNNRIEMNRETGEVYNASGGTLGCRKGPNPQKALAHPAILDWALCEYLIVASQGYKGLALDKPFDETIGKSILNAARSKFNNDVHTLTMFQNVIASSPTSNRYTFGTTDDNPSTPIPLQHYNRCFIMLDNTPNTYHLHNAIAKQLTPATIKKRVKDQVRMQQHDPIATEMLMINGVNIQSLPTDKEAAIQKVTGVEESWYMRVDNRDLHLLSQSEIDMIFNNLDYDKYLKLLKDSFENNWRNKKPKDITPKQTKTKKPIAHNLFDVNTTPVTQPSSDKKVIPVTQTSDDETVIAAVANESQSQKQYTDTKNITDAKQLLLKYGVREADTNKVLNDLISVLTCTPVE